ncbi:hypothetical protein K320107C7_04280 [Alistipes shahii]|uniref:DUF4998 domain-containing protein n=1 Tax=Alistipes shahii TaxID=328814 RepID=UPI0036F37384
MKIIFEILLAGAVASLAATACGDMDSIHEQYSGRPEKIYIGRVDSLKAHGGLNRTMLSWYMNSDPKIDSTVIYWNFRQDSLVKPFVRTTPGMQKDSVFIEGLGEGNFNFEVYNRNVEGLYSMIQTVSGHVYGDAYINGLRQRAISSVTVTPNEETQSNSIEIVWGDADMLNAYSEIVYTEKSTGKRETIHVTSEKNPTNQALVTKFDDVGNVLGDESSSFEVVCYYIPEKGACDTIPKRYAKQFLTYVANGSRVQYTGGKAGNPMAWTNYGKILQRVNDNTYDCNFIGGWRANAISLFRLTIKEDNTVDMVGYYGNYSWTLTNTDGTVSTYDPETKSFDLKYTVITNASGDYTEMQEKVSPRY